MITVKMMIIVMPITMISMKMTLMIRVIMIVIINNDKNDDNE